MKNYEYLMKDEAIKSKIPERLRKSSNWDGYKKLDTEYYKHKFTRDFLKFFGGYFRRTGTVRPRWKPASSAGKSWKAHGIKKKRDFHSHEERDGWIASFLEFGHIFNWIEPYSAAPKDELTKTEDIHDKKSRVFYVAGVLTDYAVDLMCGEFNAGLKLMPWNSCGEVWQYGGFNRMGRQMQDLLESDEDLVIEESDCSKYDLTCIPFFMDLCHHIRSCITDSEDGEYADRLMWLYRIALKKYLIWFDGDILVCNRGNPSGWKNTTEDNCLRHMFIRWFHFTRLGMTSHEFFSTVFLRVLSDDSICIAPTKYLSEDDLNYSYTTWNTVYKGYVQPLSRTVDKHTYLGATFEVAKDGTVSYKISPSKAFWSALYRKGLNRKQFANKLESLAVLGADDPVWLDKFCDFVAKEYGKSYVPRRGRVKYLASGLRGGPGVFPPGLAEPPTSLRAAPVREQKG
jgi:hypothetical protein